MYYYRQKLSDSNKRIYVNLRNVNSLFTNSLESIFSRSQKSSKAVRNYDYLNHTRVDIPRLLLSVILNLMFRLYD